MSEGRGCLGQPLPPVDEGKGAWYKWVLFRDDPGDPSKGISYGVQAGAAKSANSAAGIPGHGSTHAGRKIGPVEQKMTMGTPIPDLLQMGQWDATVGRTCYIRVIGPDAIAGNAGFPSKDVYFIERGMVSRNTSLYRYPQATFNRFVWF
jgi:hypothetical protein